MPYTNPDGTAKYINNAGLDSGGFLVAASTGAMTDVYAQDLTLLGPGATFSECTVSNGGVLSMGSGTTLSNTTMYAGGSMQLDTTAAAMAKLVDCELSGGKVTVKANNYVVSGGTVYSGAEISGLQSATYSGVTVKSGGRLTNGNNVFYYGVTFESGATITGNVPRFFGSENNIAKGTLASYQTAYTSGGVLCDITTVGAIHFRDITVSNLTVNGNHYVYVSSGTVLRGATLKNGTNAAAPMLFPRVYAYNVSAANSAASLQIHYGKDDASAITLAGSQTTVYQGCIRYFDTAYNVSRVDPDIFIKDGVISSMTLKYNGNTAATFQLTRLRLAEGITAQSPVISSGGTLFVSSGVSILDPNVYDSGRIMASSGTLVSGGTVYAGGEIGGNEQYVSYTNVTVKSGGKLTNGNNTFYTDVNFESGATVAYGGAPRFIGSGNNIAKGTLSGHQTAYTSGGVLYDFRVVGATHFSNIVVSNLNVAGNYYLYVSRGTVLRDVALNNGNNAAAPMLFPGVYAYNVSAVNSNAVLQIHYGKEAASAVTLAGDRTTIHQGGIRYFDESYNKYRVDPDLFIENGVISSMTLKYNGNTSTTFMLTNLRLAEGIKAQSPVVSSGGTLFVSSGATLLDPQVYSGGKVSAFDGALISGGVFSGASAITDVNRLLYLGDGAEARGFTLTGAYMSAVGAVVSSATVSAGARIYAYSGTVLSDCVFSGSNGSAQSVRLLHISSGAEARDITLSGALAYISQGGAVNGALVASGGFLWGFDAADQVGTERPILSAANITVLDGGDLTIRGVNARGSGITVSGGVAYLTNGASVQDITMFGGELRISANAGTGMIDSGAAVSVKDVKAVGGLVNVTSGGMLTDFSVAAGATLRFAKDDGHATLQGANTNIAEGTLYFGTTAIAGRAVNGVLSGLDANKTAFQLSVGDGIVVRDAVLEHTSARISAFDGASVDGALVKAGAIICNAGASGTIADVTLAGGQLNLSGTVTAERTVIAANGRVDVDANTALLADTTLQAGGTLNLVAGAQTGATLTLDYTGAATSSVNINYLNRLAGSTTVRMTGVAEAGTYGIATSAGTLAKVTCADGLYSDVVANGASYTNGIAGLTYSFDGTTLTAADAGVAAVAAAASLADATTINGSDKAAKWTANTTYSTNVFLADGLTTGDAWLDIDGFSAAANVYGAAKNQNFTGRVNIGALTGTVKNLAAGAALGGSVAGVKLTVGDAMSVTGAVYAGGMGDVTGATETLIEGGTFSGNVFAGALCNYAANATATDTGAINLTVDGGTFAGNIYAGAAVKAGAAASVVHTAGDITVELNGGTATRQTFCVYGGGYATGTVEDAPVYEAGDVAITVAGGAWGTYLSGRGIFGGAYADKVAASVDSVAITVTGGTMGNVYGGGWAQNGGTSTVAGEVSITIAGDAAVSNVFGGGSYSGSSYGATSVGSVNILIAGGDVANNIFAGGQNEYSTVAGDVSVTFTGANDYSCSVYGYGVQASATVGGDKSLAFAGYTGTLSGAIGGFDGIVFSGDTAATLSGETIDNDDWSFDYTGRALDAGLAMLTLSNGSFTGDTVAVDLAAAEQSAGGWSIAAGLDSADATFSVELATGSASGLALGDALDSSYSIYEGWGFALEDSTLKFKQLA